MALPLLLIMKKFCRQSKNSILWLVCGVLYYIVVRYTAFSLPCPFRYITGYLCPGCGITTMLLALGAGDIEAAQRANIFLFYTLPWLLLSVALRKYLPLSYLRLLDKSIYPAYVVALICFGIYRNL